MTFSRAQWLRKLLEGPAHRRSTVVGCHCMRLGWTDWYKRTDGGPPLLGHPECITDAGRAALKAFEEKEKSGTRPITDA